MWPLFRGMCASSLDETSKVLTRMFREEKKFLKYLYI